MNSSSLNASPSPSSSFASFTKLEESCKPNPRRIQFDLHKAAFSLKSRICLGKFDANLSFRWKSNARKPESFAACSTTATGMPLENPGLVGDKLQRLVSEFKSLREPIDRVKRLLWYAGFLPLLDESARVPANRVTGCATQVWLDAKIDEFGKMRFRADSDSEITKGFCSCLIWMLDGAEPEEVLEVRMDDLSEMNVGVHGKARSRVNTWHNVLIDMQKRTIGLLAQRDGKLPLAPFSSLVATAEGIRAGGSHAKAQVLIA